ncbi:membrane-bound H2-uptake (NiFe)-hydrogenase (Group 1), b-type cytochrome subunit [Candidatus Desulfosporosinus infrequens]|uniref:Membrane-bound H2-uptake (NiFe)-hydrogenase (Group 1), b-type cytochrome subunit n=1 Tax=Candidatus Desulfosporosinus infrequens TaxID=2043169 RepID=A0A2U3KEK3_9FIRM|nr:membrane-bound H2-uptake (NiFe)-hydrogenase (Group 1), b-type cytochrome subunit [Candidatus Desulfosporosinus infrequens]
MKNMKQHANLNKSILRQLIKRATKDQFIPFQSIWVRVFHWGFAFSLTVVILTGLELHKPASFIALNYGNVLMNHIVFSWLALGFVAIRIADALIRQDHSLIPGFQDFKRFPKLMAYYFFLRFYPPPSRKYNSGQLLIYFSWIFLFLVASLLGLTSYWQGQHLIFVWRMVGGFQVLRWIKFTICIYFLATIPLHIYLSLTENISRLQAMITGYERKPPPNNS